MPENGSSSPSTQAINRALTSISVASAHVQLVRRWLERGRLDRMDEMLDSLRTSERALQDSASTIRGITETPSKRPQPPDGAE